EAFLANRQLPELGLVLFTFGNVSVVDRAKEVFAIKPSGIPYQDLSPEVMTVVDFDGNVVEGTLRPSSDTKTHAVLYRAWPLIGAITHTHSTYASSWAQSGRDIPIYGTTHADHNTVDIPCTLPMSDEMILGDYEYETGQQVLQCFEQRDLSYEAVEMVLIGSHAPFTWGKTAEKAVYNSAVLEQIAHMAWLTEQINPQTSRLKDALIQKHFERKHVIVIDLKKYEVWFVTGSQHLYGAAVLEQVAKNAQTIANYLNSQASIPVQIVFKPVVKTMEEITALCKEANHTENCAGLITWMHTFSPAKMWINGLKQLIKPTLHLHTQFNRDIPWSEIDMNFMNLNQSAHGDREYGYIVTRLGLNRKVVVGYWQDPNILGDINDWARAACAWQDWQGARFIRFGDNMRNVAVTEGDKIQAEIDFGYTVNTFAVGDLVKVIHQVSDDAINGLLQDYAEQYELAHNLTESGDAREALREAARIELGMEAFLQQENAKGFTNTFEDLHGMAQLPGIASQRLMAKGYGFAAEGDWKTAALIRAMKVMGAGLAGGCSFMEDYTYHFDPANPMVLGAHMLEVCPTIAAAKPRVEVHHLGIGGKAAPVRLVFNAKAGPALNASLLNMGNHFRLLVNTVKTVDAPHEMPKLPVARAFWQPNPDLKTACAAWIYAGGAHHTSYSQNVTTHMLDCFADISRCELVLIDEQTQLSQFRKELRWNEQAYAR
ncbi:unnamed protein product, partial [Darwinula stevensoni]